MVATAIPPHRLITADIRQCITPGIRRATHQRIMDQGIGALSVRPLRITPDPGITDGMGTVTDGNLATVT